MTTQANEIGTDSLIVARNIRAQLAVDQMPLRDLAERTGISLPTLSRIQSGKRVVDIDQIRKISDGLEIPIAQLLQGVL